MHKKSAGNKEYSCYFPRLMISGYYTNIVLSGKPLRLVGSFSDLRDVQIGGEAVQIGSYSAKGVLVFGLARMSMKMKVSRALRISRS